MNDCETVALTQTTSNVFKNGVAKKMKDPRSFMVHCLIGGMDLGRALCDIGVSTYLMPLCIFKKLEIGEVQPTHMRVQFANRSIAKPEGKIEDVLVKVDKFLFSAGFVILDYRVNWEGGTIAMKKSIMNCSTLKNVFEEEDPEYVLEEVSAVSGARKFKSLDL
ncbi:uncharacterized protein E5676_scaffold595G00370 [Cucumis melo var. makuwa]|uniref:Uncharacterized protein n=1 Tax=Cucumis melo var. makuwa TaxID=1194695 RepID=A0A5D3E346_CUCMM|nr:uncharacterized protein E6C27_scaffold550G00700 [Cucumis melo var. makuwa]TYK30219.1 uncharacterized protein E5676_scaffold595G00370 [Cucumis melo var. makuwa]